MLRTVEAAHAAVAFAPIDESAKKTAVAKMSEGGTHPVDIKRPELDITHFAAGHFKLSVHSAGYMAGNRTIVRLIGKQQPRLVVSHQNSEHPRIGRIAADDAVLT